MNGLPIGDYALLSDCRSSALVSRAGSVDWLCFPRFDGPAIFARILDADGGHFAILPVGDFQASRAYVDQTMAVQTTFRAEAGTVVLTDAMAMGHGDRGHDLGAGSPGVLMRRLQCTEGEVDVDVSYAPRPEYGLIYPILEEVTGGIAARGGASRLLLSAPPGFQLAGATATTRIHLRFGQTVSFALQHRPRSEPPLVSWDAGEIAARLQDTIEGWRSWSAIHQTYQGPWRELVHHSGRVLQALTFHPTGAIVAAPTTSLPETIGGERNWDYRYTWVRDASLTMQALWVAACPDEAGRFFAFLADAAATQLQRGADLQIMFGVGGEHDLSERELPHLAGWRGSRPVRVGNGAWNQRQLDVYGELLGAAQRLAGQLGELDPVTRQFLAAAADMAARRWTEKDQGIWEIRGEPRDFLYSKLMCWVALDRAIDLAPRLDSADRVQEWAAARDEIRAAILQRGWNEQAGAFTQAFGSEDLDASSLMLAITGFLPGDDPRVKATADAIAARLTDQRGLVYRYLSQDGLAGQEGTFLLCTFWLAHAQALAGELGRATATFERAMAAMNDVGLLAEEVDPGSGEMTGNFPQAFSHIGLVNAAWAIAQASERAASGSGCATMALPTFPEARRHVGRCGDLRNGEVATRPMYPTSGGVRWPSFCRAATGCPHTGHRARPPGSEEIVTTAIIGTGGLGSVIARQLAAGGETLRLSSADSGSARALAAEVGGGAVAAAGNRDALHDAGAVILALRFTVLKAVIDEIAPALAGRVVVVPSNPLTLDAHGNVVRVLPEGQSSGNVVTGWLPAGALPAMAFGTMSAGLFQSASNRSPERAVLFYVTDDDRAGQEVERLIAVAGFEPVRAGGIEQSGRLEVGGDLHDLVVGPAQARSLVSRA